MQAPPQRRSPAIAAWIAVACCLAVFVAVAFIPLTSSTSTSTSGSVIRTSETHQTLVHSEGATILLVLLIPLLLALAGLVAARAGNRVLGFITVGLFWIWVLLTGFSVGLFYVPAAFALTFAAVLSEAVRSGP